ncbi:MAG: hypothetical protein SGI74_11885 [Oligoflexia bacterium]|nr:hypothetical protein [Oligoflexia bacterium]
MKLLIIALSTVFLSTANAAKLECQLEAGQLVPNQPKQLMTDVVWSEKIPLEKSTYERAEVKLSANDTIYITISIEETSGGRIIEAAISRFDTVGQRKWHNWGVGNSSYRGMMPTVLPANFSLTAPLTGTVDNNKEITGFDGLLLECDLR